MNNSWSIRYMPVTPLRSNRMINNSRKHHILLIHPINNIIYNDIYLENNIPYQEISIETEIENNTELMEFNISYNKQRIIKKLLNIIKGD